MNSFQLPECQVYQPEIRFVDIDAAGIVNNATYFNYFEQRRIQFFEGLVGSKWNWQEAGMVVARHEIDYRLPILFNDDVRIVTWVERVGEKSMTAAYEVMKCVEGKWLKLASASSVLVSYNHNSGKTLAWPSKMLEPIQAFGLGRPNF